MVAAVGADPIDLQFEGALLFVGQLQAEATDLGGVKSLVWQLRAAPGADETSEGHLDLGEERLAGKVAVHG